MSQQNVTSWKISTRAIFTENMYTFAIGPRYSKSQHYFLSTLLNQKLVFTWKIDLQFETEEVLPIAVLTFKLILVAF